MSNYQEMASDVTLTALGQKGKIILTDTTAITGVKIRAIQCLSDTVFTTLTDTTSTTNGIETTAVAADYGTVPAGTVLYGKFTAVTLTSGRVILYK